MRGGTAAVHAAMVALPPQAAVATPAWDGTWFLDPAASRWAAQSFTLEPIGRGMWRYDDSSTIQILAPPGSGPVAEPMQPGAQTETLELTANSVRFAAVVRGRTVETITKQLGPDGRHLTGTDTVVRADGTARVAPTLDERLDAGTGLAGHWRSVPDPAPAGSQIATHPTWIISTDAAGVMTWTIPRTGETLVGAADGQPHPSAGPGQPAGRFFTWQEVSPTHVEFRAYDTDRLVEETDDVLSADGHTWAELIWHAGTPDEKNRLVYRRR